MFRRKVEDEEKAVQPALNPNQRQFMEDERRYREKLQMLDGGNESKSPTHFYMRPKEPELDAEALDKNDSFYHTTKSLLVLFQIMGVMPIMRSAPGSGQARTTFSWCSKAFMWAYFIYGLLTVVVVMTFRERVKNFLSSERRFDEVIYNVIFLSILLPHFLLPLASWRNGAEVAKFKNMWTTYQLKYLKVAGTPIIFPRLYPITWGLCIISWGLAIVLMFVQYYFQPDFLFWHTFAYYHILAMLNGFCSLWYINCTAFTVASRALSLKLQEAMFTPKPAQKLTEYRHLWVDLSHMMQQLGKAYSNMYGIYCLIIFFTTIIATYGALSEIIDHGATYKEVGLFTIVFYCMSLLFIICNEAHFASKSVGLDFQTKLLNVNLTAVDKETEKEVEMFLVAIEKNPPTMNLDGYADINRGLLSSNVSFMATYLVVLLQFKLTLLRQTYKNNLLKAIRENVTMLMNQANANRTNIG